MTDYVYLIEAQIGVAKIGFGYSPAQRLAAVRTHSPVPVRLIAQWAGGRTDEAELHRRFVRHRSHCEWFRIEGEFLVFIAGVYGRGLVSVEPWSEVAFDTRAKKVRRNESAAEKKRKTWADPATKLVWLGQIAAGRMQKHELGDLPWQTRTPQQSRRLREIRIIAHEKVRSSPKGEELIRQIIASGANIPSIPGYA